MVRESTADLEPKFEKFRVRLIPWNHGLMHCLTIVGGNMLLGIRKVLVPVFGLLFAGSALAMPITFEISIFGRLQSGLARWTPSVGA
jgi:hypothetical protein